MTRLVVGACALLLVLAGCGGDPKASPSPSSSAPVTPASTTPSPPVLPEEAKANTKAGAIAFVRHYIELINYAQESGEVQVLEQVEDPRCVSCENGRDAIVAIYESGGSIAGGRLTFRYTSGAESARYEGWLISGVLRFGPQNVISEAGGQPESLGGGKTPVNAFVSNQNSANEWRVMDWTRGS